MAGVDTSSYFLSFVRVVFLCVLCVLHFKPASNLNFNTVNIATGKNYSQSSTRSANEPSSRAADDRMSTCICTRGDGNVQQWWEVDLGNEYPVYAIGVGGLANSLTNLYPFEITVNGNFYVRLETGRGMDAIISPNIINGRIVRLTRTKTDGLELILCELWIFVCLEGWYGKDCGEPCPVYCKGGCKDKGYCNECDDGRYGDGCNSTCGRCKGGAACSKTDGRCPEGLCETGWQSQLCQTACQNHTYGPDCKQRCGQCQDHLPCDPHTGDCPAGCQPGYIDQRCQATSEVRQDGLPVAAVTSVSIVVTVIVCTIVFLGIVWYRKRARRTSHKSKLETTDREATNHRNPTQDRSASEEEMQQSEYDGFHLENAGFDNETLPCPWTQQLLTIQQGGHTSQKPH